MRLDAAGIARTGPHRFRHTGATLLANDANIPIAQLKEFLGHKDLKITQRYLHPRPEHIQQTISRVDFTRLTRNNPLPPETPETPETPQAPEPPEAMKAGAAS